MHLDPIRGSVGFVVRLTLGPLVLLGTVACGQTDLHAASGAQDAGRRPVFVADAASVPVLVGGDVVDTDAQASDTDSDTDAAGDCPTGEHACGLCEPGSFYCFDAACIPPECPSAR